MANKTKRIRYAAIFWNITKKSKIIYIFLLFILLYFIFTGLIFYFDKQAFNNFGDALWFTFVSIFTIGYGDLNVTTVMSRVFTVILVIYATVIIAIFTGIWATMISEIMRIRVNNDGQKLDYEKLCALETLSKEELEELSNHFKDIRDNKKRKEIEDLIS